MFFGGLTQLCQTYLPSWLHSLANSAAPWVLVAVGLALLARTAWAASLAGFIALACLEIGYVAVAAVRDLPSSWTTVTFWLMAAAVFGPAAGLAAYLFQARRSPWDALGGGLIAGIVSGEAVGSYLTVRDTTTPGYWIMQAVAGAVVAALIGKRTSYLWVIPAFAVGVAGLVATRFVPVFAA